jgi:hypothetical protein
MIVPCGPDGTGYIINIPTSTLKTLVPAMKWGFFFLKVALATQGIGGVVPDLGSLLPEMACTNFLDSYMTSLTETLNESSVEAVEGLFDEMTNIDDSEALSEAQKHTAANLDEALQCVAQLVRKEETGSPTGGGPNWEPRLTGLVKVKSEKAESGSLWVSPACIDEYREHGIRHVP